MSRALTFALMLIVMGCAPQNLEPVRASARFDSFPDALFARAREACSEPTETFVQISREQVECRFLLSPQQTAAVILRYDGVVEDLPQAVVRFDARPSNPGYVVDVTTYVRVPQRNGVPLRISSQDRVQARRFGRILTLYGGSMDTE